MKLFIFYNRYEGRTSVIRAESRDLAIQIYLNHFEYKDENDEDYYETEIAELSANGKSGIIYNE
jgi:hypothetical protein